VPQSLSYVACANEACAMNCQAVLSNKYMSGDAPIPITIDEIYEFFESKQLAKWAMLCQ
jgi:hypothetical protein